jgi:predicted nucleic acid-binding protein
MTLVDTNVLMDVLLAGAEHGEESAARLARALEFGPAVVNDVVAAELAPLFAEERSLWTTLARAQIRHVPSRVPRSISLARRCSGTAGPVASARGSSPTS